MAENTKKEKPILFQSEMIQALLDGRKTQTRRITNLKWINDWPDKWLMNQMDADYGKFTGDYIFRNVDGYDGKPIPGMKVKCPYGKLGDRLWVKESFWHSGSWNFTDGCSAMDGGPGWFWDEPHSKSNALNESPCVVSFDEQPPGEIATSNSPVGVCCGSAAPQSTCLVGQAV